MANSFAAAQLVRLEALLAQCTGVSQITVDGQTMVYDDLLHQYNYWKSRVARANKTRPRSAQIYLGVFR